MNPAVRNETLKWFKMLVDLDASGGVRFNRQQVNDLSDAINGLIGEKDAFKEALEVERRSARMAVQSQVSKRLRAEKRLRVAESGSSRALSVSDPQKYQAK